jgi:RNA polymerase sigma-70 factor, ECF subfamily
MTQALTLGAQPDAAAQSGMTSTVPTDAELVAAVRADGDEVAFRSLYRRHTPRLYQMVLRLLAGSEADAEDVVQETWLKATTSLDRFRWESAFGTWLTGIGLN